MNKPPDPGARLAALGESLAATFLENEGFELLARNWRAGRGELDIVARDGDVIAFVEVKTRSSGPQDPLEAISAAKRREIRRAAGRWIHRHPGVGREFRFDAIGVRIRRGSRPTIEHVRNAFFGDD